MIWRPSSSPSRKLMHPTTAPRASASMTVRRSAQLHVRCITISSPDPSCTRSTVASGGQSTSASSARLHEAASANIDTDTTQTLTWKASRPLRPRRRSVHSSGPSSPAAIRVAFYLLRVFDRRSSWARSTESRTFLRRRNRRFVRRPMRIATIRACLAIHSVAAAASPRVPTERSRSMSYRHRGTTMSSDCRLVQRRLALHADDTPQELLAYEQADAVTSPTCRPHRVCKARAVIPEGDATIHHLGHPTERSRTVATARARSAS